MILVFGGTTEGRATVKTLEEADSLYHYSTRSDGQEVELLHGIRLTGGMEVPAMIQYCREHDIRLMIDAAHPFAEELHRNLLYAASHLSIPIIRYDRIYPPHTDDITWCKDYQDAADKLEAQGIDSLLALTGVNTISKLRPYWEDSRTGQTPAGLKHECWFRILNRQASNSLARKAAFPEDHLVYYDEDDTATLLEQLKPQAILTKESGISGGFCEKVETAKAAGIKVFAIERPEYPPHTPVPQHVHIERVNGPHGLRRAVETLLPEFYPLHSGLTTGTCATAAAVAAALRLFRNETPASVPVVLPNGETITVPVGYGDDYAFCIKHAGDDPDVTNGLEIRAMVKQATDGIEILGGEGVGTFTLPGFDYPLGSPAINKAPRQMIRENLAALQQAISPAPLALSVTIAVPKGAEVASRTFNPRLGIEGGISIIGVSGIVKPFSEEAFIESIHKCLEVAKASDTSRLVINSGAKSERTLRAYYPTLPQQAFVEYGNYIGRTLQMGSELGFKTITLGIMLGKAVKLAKGQLDTHSRQATMDRAFVQQMLNEAGCNEIDFSTVTLARELWQLIPPDKLAAFCRVVIDHCHAHTAPLLPGGELTILLIDDDGRIHTGGMPT